MSNITHRESFFCDLCPRHIGAGVRAGADSVAVVGSVAGAVAGAVVAGTGTVAGAVATPYMKYFPA